MEKDDVPVPHLAIVCDLETTGLNPLQDEIIEIALLRLVEGEITDQFHTLIRPKQKVPEAILRLTGLSEKLLAASPSLDEVLPLITNFLGKNPLIGHNVSFDRNFLQTVTGIPVVTRAYDTRELARILLPDAPSYQLAELCRFLGIEVKRVHRAMDDALAAVQLYRRLLDKTRKMDGQVLLYLTAFLQQAGSPWADEISSVALESCSQKIKRTLLFKPPIEEIEQDLTCPPDFPQSPQELFDLLKPGGSLAVHMVNYEYRPQQLHMVEAVTRALEEEKILLMEAGTGTGKSMAYLLPALYWSISHKQRVLIATRTINLQEQLWQKDIPLIKTALGWPCRVALVKGRQNYLCLQRWLTILQAGNWTAGEAAFYARILVWTQQTVTGDKSEINLTGFEQELWQELCSDSETCQGSRCRWFARSCYVSRIRFKAEKANLIIVNHSLLLSDVRAENRLLPEHAVLIVDEAHHLEDAATEQLGETISRSALFRWLNKVNRILVRIKELSLRENTSLNSYHQKCLGAYSRVRQAVDLFFNLLQMMVIQKSLAEDQDIGNKYIVRLQPGSEGDITSILQPERENLLFALKDLLTGLKKISEHIESFVVEDEENNNLTWEFTCLIAEGTRILAVLEFILKGTMANSVFWVEIDKEENNHCFLRAAPIQVNKILYDYLYQTKKSIVLTSATLTVENSFTHYIERTGLDLIPPERILALRVDSPFQYDSQALLCIVKGLPTPGKGKGGIYFSTLASTLLNLADTTGGRMLVLFTSHQALRETYHRLKPECLERGIRLLGHNLDGNQWHILKEFHNTEKAILMGALSFWEGVDLPGPALNCVVMVKLPFWAPRVPVVEARLEDLASQGKDGFLHFSLPQAIIRFKQGFGRLIRTTSDRGVVIILDERLLNKKYGRHFLNSLPVKNYIEGDLSLLKKQIARWLNPDAACHIKSNKEI